MIGKDAAVVKRTLARYWNTTRAHGGLFAADVLASIALSGLVSFGNPYVMARIIDRISEGAVASDQVVGVFGGAIIALVLINVAGQAASKFQDYATWKLQIYANFDLATLCFDTLSNQSMTFHSERYGGALVSQTTKFMNAYAMVLESLIYTIIPITCAAVFTVAILGPVVPLFVAILAVLLAAYVLLAYHMYTRILPLNTEAAKSYNRLFGRLSDSVTNIMAVKTYGREGRERSLFTEANEDVLATDSRRMRASTLRSVGVSSIIVAMTVLLAVFATGGNAWFGIAPGTLVMMFTYTYTLTTQFDRIGLMLQQLNRSFGDAHEMTVILDEPLLVEDAPDAAELDVREGRIDFESIGFSYARGTGADGADGAGAGTGAGAVAEAGAEAGETSANDAGSPTSGKLFHDFVLHIPAGQRIGLVGRSGAGKTTITALLLRLSDIQEGRILVDGQNIACCTQESLRRNIAYVPQEALLFHRSIRENIAYGRPEATDAEVERAAEQANALDFIRELPRGFDTEVGERGATLSGGQRQRIAIARAILADAPILVLDEATSALDSESERLVQGALANLMRGRTSIVIAHRLSTVADLDRIVVLEHGRIVEDGTHAQLLETGGTYATLWNYQTGLMK
ncbi:MAG TPA: ABC transporter ATP-binding protein [Eggerthellaceae bacterium]|nr:ABC transporter ATP-binding protein [Eggerthellaceae bacterium]